MITESPWFTSIALGANLHELVQRALLHGFVGRRAARQPRELGTGLFDFARQQVAFGQAQQGVVGQRTLGIFIRQPPIDLVAARIIFGVVLHRGPLAQDFVPLFGFGEPLE